MANLKLNNICVTYDGKTNILDRYNLEIEEGELVSILGPSGCGKTTTLRTVAGFIPASSGEILVDGSDVNTTPVNKRNFGIVFQSYALFPNMTVFENIAFGLQMKKIDSSTIKNKVEEILKVVELFDMKDRKPANLSGGQRQRVALARALVIEPKLLLLDEPLSNLDAKLRVDMRNSIRAIQKKIGMTTIFVTHDQEECFAISDKVAIMNRGVIEQYDTPETIYSNPSTKFVADFVGFKNFFPLERVEKDIFKSNGVSLSTNGSKNDNVTGTIRPQHIKIGTGEYNNISGIISLKTFLGQEYQYLVETKLGQLVISSKLEENYKQGDEVSLSIPKDKLILL